MAKKYSLKIQYTPDFKVIGVFCPIKDYRFCWMLNESLRFSFNYFGEFPLISGEKSTEIFNVYEYREPTLNLRIFILNNRNINRLIFAEPPQLDFLMLIQADEARHNMNELLSKIRSISGVNAAYILDKQLGKTAEEVFYDFEVFVSNIDLALKKISFKTGKKLT